MPEILKIEPTSAHDPKPTEITLKFDSPKEIEGKWGPQWMYTVIHNGEEKTLYATKGLHGRIDEQGGKAGDTFSIIRTGSGKETRWDVMHVNDLHLRGDARQNPQPNVSAPTAAAPADAKSTYYTRLKQYAVAWNIAERFLSDKGGGDNINAVAFTFYKMAQDVGYDLRLEEGQDTNPKA